MTDCKLVEELMPLYADELTSPETSEWIKAHLAECSECRAMWNRCAEPLPQETAIDESKIKKAMMKDARRMTWEGLKRFLIISLVPVLMMTGFLIYVAWSYGAFAPVENTASAYSEIFGGEMTVEVLDRDKVGPRMGGQGSILRIRQEYEDLYGKTNEWKTCWEDVRIDIAPNGTFLLLSGVTPDGRTDYFIIAYRYELDDMGGWVKTRLYPRQPENVRYGYYQDGLTAILTQYCRDNPEIAQDWEEIHFTFKQWSGDSRAVEFFYWTDTGEIGTVWYSMEGQESTGLGTMSYAKAMVRG